MAKLYPPYIAGSLPAFTGTKVYLDEKDENGNPKYWIQPHLIVPFVMNKTVSQSEVGSFQVLVKSIQNNDVISTETNSSIDWENHIVRFNLGKELSKGTAYKVQIAYKSDGVIGYYSTVGIAKYTTLPRVYIDGFNNTNIIGHQETYVGVYSQTDEEGNGKEYDASEKVYSYNFTIYAPDGSIYDTSGDQLHNHETDYQSNESHDVFRTTKVLEPDLTYSLVYTVTTTNGLVVSSPTYRIRERETIDPEVKVEVTATMNEENGYVDLKVIGEKDKDGIEVSAAGTFLLSRASSEDNYTSWTEINRFVVYGTQLSQLEWKDFTVAHGFDYKYSFQQYNKTTNLYSNRIISNTITAYYEHSFLYDGERQLKIKYNPKVSSFKETVLESKTNTLGGKYPFFFRNGNVGYKEFPISGLISYHMDEEQLFLKDEDMGLDNLDKLIREHTLKPGILSTNDSYFYSMEDLNAAYALQAEYKKREQADSQENQISGGKQRTTNLVDYNIVAERIFKLEVLKFLNDGKPKLFRSPGEGNYLVRLMNVTMSPNDQLSRMLHSFQANATEIDDCTSAKLDEYGLLNVADPVITQMRWTTVMNAEVLPKTRSEGAAEEWISIGNEKNIYSIQVLDMVPGDRIRLTMPQTNLAPSSDFVVTIGTTGAYYASFEDPIDSVEISSKAARQGQITYSYKSDVIQKFDTYKAIIIHDIPARQVIGGDPAKDIKIILENNCTDTSGNVILNKMQFVKYYMIKFTKREVLEATRDSDGNIQTGSDISLNPLAIYKVGDKYYDGQKGDGANLTEIKDYFNKIYIDNKEIDITDTQDYLILKPETVPEIRISSGVIAEAAYQLREIVYSVEEDNNHKNIQEKQDYLDAIAELDRLLNINLGESATEEDEIKLQQDIANQKTIIVQNKQKYYEKVAQLLKELEVSPT